MDPKRRNEIWESKDKNRKIKPLLEELVEDLEKKPKTKRDSYIDNFLRDLVGEKELLGDRF